MMADDGYQKLCKIKALLSECMVPPRESKFLNLDRYLEDENGVTFIPDPPQWCNISFRGFQERVLTFRPQYWGADPNATLWFSKYGWRCVEKFLIKCEICSSTVECSSLIQKPDLWDDLARKAHDNLCYWSFCPCPDRFIQIITHPKILCKNVSLNWKKIMAYGVELPKIQTVLLDKMGFSRDVLDHLFKIIESNYSEEGLSALVLAICGWLKSSEDKILECAYCQRNLALRHFISVEESREVTADLHSHEQISLEKRVTEITESDNSDMETSTTSSDFISQRRKPVNRALRAVYCATALHKANPRTCITKLNFRSFCNLTRIRYGFSLQINIRTSQQKRASGRLHTGKENSGNETLKMETDSQDKESNQKLSYNQMKMSEEKSSENTCDSTVTNGQKKLSCGDNGAQSNTGSDNLKEKQVVVTEEAATKMGSGDSSKLKKDEDTATECSETEKSDVNRELTGLSKSSYTITENKDAVEKSRNSTENTNKTHNCATGEEKEQSTVTTINISEPSVICLSESRSSTEIEHSVGENSFEKQDTEVRPVEKNVSTTNTKEDMEVDNIVTSPSTEKPCTQTGKRELTSDDKALEEPPNKKIKDSVESPQHKKKNLNPVNEHRFWCIWRIKTVDRLMGSTKEGWRQILDLLKFGVSPQPSELEEQESVDLFEEVKKIHYMMIDW